jgi:hypothetical protein
MGCGCEEQGTLATVAAGIVGLAKVAAQAAGLPVDQAPDDVIAARRDCCRHCPLASRSERFAGPPHRGLSSRSICRREGGGCGCLILAKTRLASEACPLGWWLEVGSTAG